MNNASQHFEQLIGRRSDFITRLKANAQYELISVFSQSSTHRDVLIRLGTGYQGNPILDLRLIEIRHGSSWYRYLTSVLKPDVLPPYVVGDLYSRLWRIEESFLLLKRLLGLSYLWTGEPLRWAGSPQCGKDKPDLKQVAFNKIETWGLLNLLVRN